MCSTLTGDAFALSCAPYCKAHEDRHCSHCLCAACPFCTSADRSSATTPPPPLQDSTGDAAAVSELRRRFLGSSGVVMRIWECSLAGCVGRGDDEPNPFFERCVRAEVNPGTVGRASNGPLTGSRATRPASVLRWDVPAALFKGGRCTDPALVEKARYPAVFPTEKEIEQRRRWTTHPEEAELDALLQKTENTDRFGWRRQGFSGHNVTHAAVGWVLADVRRERWQAMIERTCMQCACALCTCTCMLTSHDPRMRMSNGW